MDFADRLEALQKKAEEITPHIKSEEATKTSLILPFISLLGYDPFDPREIIPEYTADVGIKKGEKVDYAILSDGQPIMLMEVKCCGDTLDASRAKQLHRYFHATQSARIGILTDGIRYEFFSDLDSQNIMDDRPFMVFKITDYDDHQIEQLKKLSKDKFNESEALSTAQHLKYTREIKKLIGHEITNPSDEIVKYFAKKVYTGNLVPNVLEDFRERVREAFTSYIADGIQSRLQTAMGGNFKRVSQDVIQPEVDEGPKDIKSRIVTTDEEWEGFYFVKSIVREVTSPDRVFIRDTLSYCGILLDDNNRKPICRLHLNSSQKYLGIFEGNKEETKFPINRVDDIFQYALQIRKTVIRYDTPDGSNVFDQDNSNND